MNEYILSLFIIIGFIVGWIVGTEKLNTSKTTIKHQSLFNYLLGK